MKSTELRLGNLIEYKIEDELDERKEWWEVSKVDFQDLTWLDSNPEDADFRPIKLTEEWLLKFGFYKSDLSPYNRWVHEYNDFEIEIQGDKYAYVLWGGESAPFLTQFLGHSKHVHQLQNLYFALTGEELTQVSEGKNKNFV